MVTADVALARCRRTGGADPCDLYPDPDAAPLEAALRDLGASTTSVSWDDPGVDWASFARIVISSTWDSVDRPLEYLAWVRRVSAASLLVNAASVIEWNLHKIHQLELAAAGVPVVPTKWVGPGDRFEPPAGRDFVVKPSISAGGRSTARYAGGDPAALVHVESLRRAGQMTMVQEYVSAVDDGGELDLIFVAGLFSHAVAKEATLRTGEGIVDRPWERMAWTGVATPSPEQLLVAERAMAAVSERLAPCPVYGRVDLVPGPAGRPLVLEVELIDPYLSLDMEPGAASRLASALLR